MAEAAKEAKACTTGHTAAWRGTESWEGYTTGHTAACCRCCGAETAAGADSNAAEDMAEAAKEAAGAGGGRRGEYHGGWRGPRWCKGSQTHAGCYEGPNTAAGLVSHAAEDMVEAFTETTTGTSKRFG